jgi:hypothetical protein
MNMNAIIIVLELTYQAFPQELISQKIRSYGNWARIASNAYLIKTSHTPVQIRDQLVPLLGGADKIFVGSCPVPSAWHGQPEDVSKWILQNQPE